jgi:TonB-linked SusC/RagA family outer membrane protein
MQIKQFFGMYFPLLTKKSKIIFIVVVSVLMSYVSTGYAQQGVINVTGTVTEQGTPLPGVNVVIKGTTAGVVTDADGEYKITVPDSETVLMFSFVGYLTRELIVGNRTVINVEMEEDAQTLDEVVVIGYGKQNRVTVTNSISRVGEEEFKNAPGINPLMQLQGKVAGLTMEISNGAPGSNPNFFIRGGTSTSPQSDTPLIIVDGIVSQGNRSIQDMNPDDVESIQVLKDAASTAIYGAKAANGIIIVKTKSGRKGKAVVNVRYTYGIEQQPERISLLNARDYIYLTRRNTQKFNAPGKTATTVDPDKFLSGSFGMSTGNPRNSKNTLEFLDVYLQNYGQQYVDQLIHKEGWQTMPDPVTGKTLIFQDNDFQKAVFRTGVKQEIDFDVSGGTDKTTYYIGMGYLNQDGIVRGNNYKNYSILFNGEYQLSEKWSINTKTSFQLRDNNGAGNINNVISRSVLMPPTYRMYYEDGTPAPGEGISSFRNRLHEIYYKTQYNDATVYRTTLQVGANWDILPGLSFTPSAYFFTAEGLENYFEADNETTGKNIRPASANHNLDRHIQADALLTYDKQLAQKHNMSAVVGGSYTSDYSYRMSGSGSGSLIDQIPTLNATADSTQRVSTTKSYEAMLSYFGRINYHYDNKYMVSVSLRVDGSSRFAENNRWGYFPGVSAGWNMHREEFFTPLLSVVSKLKVRSSWGKTGNNNLSIYNSRGQYKITDTNYEGSVGILNTTLKNADLVWESTTSFDVGVDLGFWGDRLTVLVDYYNKLTDDRLFDKPLWNSTGFSNIKSNYGSIRNSGVEVELGARPVHTGDWTWDMSITFAYNVGRVVKLPANGEDMNRVGGNFVYDKSSGDYVKVGGIAEGEKFGSRYAFNYLGPYQTDEEAAKAPTDPNAQSRVKRAGDSKFEDVDGDGILNSYDMVLMGYVRPDKVGAMVNTLRYKGLTVRLVMDWAVGHVIDNGFKGQIMGSSRNNNNAITEALTNTWQSPNDGAKYPKYSVQSDYDYQYRNHMRWDNQIGNSGTGSTNNSLYYSKGDFLAFREASVSYMFPERWISQLRMKGFEVFAGVYNIGYLKKYEGMMPEIYTGLDYGIYPRPRQYNVGARVTF